MFLGVVRVAELFGPGPAAAERLGQSTLTAARFGVRFVLAIDAELRKRDYLEPSQRNLVAASRTDSVNARAQSGDCRVDRTEALLRAVEQRRMRLDFGQRSRHIHLVGWRLAAIAGLLAHQFFYPGERLSALFGQQALERIYSPSAGANCGCHLGLLPLGSLCRSGFGSSFHL